MVGIIIDGNPDGADGVLLRSGASREPVTRRWQQMRIKDALAAGLCVLAFGSLCPAAYGQGGTLDDDEWEFVFAPYLWMVGTSGDVTMGGTEASADVYFEDILNHLDPAGWLHLEVR